MANTSLFASLKGRLIPGTNTRNAEGAPAYAFGPEHRLAQIAMTGTFNRTFYADGEAQLDGLLKAAQEVDPSFAAKTAVYARQKGFMKDTPALLLAWTSMLQTDDFAKAFPDVVDNGKMLRTFVQLMRSGVTGRKSLGTRPKRMVQAWLETASDVELMRASVGNDPSLADVIKMVHPKPKSAAREAFFAWIIGKPYDVAVLPQIVADFEAFKRDTSGPVPDVPFQMLTSLPLSKEQWAGIAERAGWHMLRMNLQTFARHGVYDVEGMPQKIARRLSDAEAIRRARVFPYQLMQAFSMTEKGVPEVIREALQDAMEIATANVPAIEGNVVVAPDVSGSMRSAVTGYRKGATSKVRCVDVAALVAATFLRANRSARVLPFETGVVDVSLNARDTVMTNAAKLAAVGGGGTNCSAPIELLVSERAKVDLVVMVSDNESWLDTPRYSRQGTGLMQAWEKLKVRNPTAKLVALDIQPNRTTQAHERADVLNIGGFSDQVFEVIAAFAKGEHSVGTWVEAINRIAL